MAQLAIRGHATRGKEVIEILEMLGGKNEYKKQGSATNDYYYIGHQNRICSLPISESYRIYIVFTLEEFLEKFPYKVGDKVIIAKNKKEAIIDKMSWCCDTITYWLKYNGFLEGNWRAEDLQPYKEETMEDRINEEMENLLEDISYNNKIVFNESLPDKTELVLGDNYEVIVEDGKTYVVRKKPQYPKTYEECLKILGYNIAHTIPMNHGHNGLLMMKLQRLLICRDAYWKIAGDWKPDWEDDSWIDMYYISYDGKIISKETGFPCCNIILIFPTEEMRDAFKENFKDLIEQCKELL